MKHPDRALGLVAAAMFAAFCAGPAAAVPAAMDPRIVDGSCTPSWPDGFAAQGSWTLGIAFLVGTQGQLLDARIIRSSGSASLDDTALRDLKRCTFAPAWIGGKPVEAWSEINRRYTRSAERDFIEHAPRREPKE